MSGVMALSFPMVSALSLSPTSGVKPPVVRWLTRLTPVAVKTDGSVVSLSEDKSQGFSNITAALSPNVAAKDWRHLSLPEEECAAVLLCTDGVADDLDNVDGFVKGFIEAHRALAAMIANRHTREMLESWPTPKHSDDKTIACLFREEVADGNIQENPFT